MLDGNVEFTLSEGDTSGLEFDVAGGVMLAGQHIVGTWLYWWYAVSGCDEMIGRVGINWNGSVSLGWLSIVYSDGIRSIDGSRYASLNISSIGSWISCSIGGRLWH